MSTKRRFCSEVIAFGRPLACALDAVNGLKVNGDPSSREVFSCETQM